MKFFSNHQPQKLSKQSQSSTDICKVASKPTNYFRINTGNPNESSDATASKGMRPTYRGVSLSTRTKLERSGHIAGYPSHQKEPTGQMQEMPDHRMLEMLDRIRNAKFTPQMDFSDMMTEYQPLQHGQSLIQFLIRDM